LLGQIKAATHIEINLWNKDKIEYLSRVLGFKVEKNKAHSKLIPGTETR